MEKVTVELGQRSYGIEIAAGSLATIGPAMQGLGLGPRIALISNPTVHALYGEAVTESLAKAGFDTITTTVPDGEQYKSLLWAERLLTDLLTARLDRGSAIVALGGGVIGDLAGFVASTYMRGIAFVQVPTTLLAQVDSSVGGKTGVNHALGKNMIGAFWQPSLVQIDQDTLKTLPQRELLAGMAEVIKYGVIWDEEFFEYLLEHRDRIMALDQAALGHIIRRSCEIKAEVVSKDERESGLRAILNYGHTIGHAVETATGYTALLHGEAVAIGMYHEALMAVNAGILKPEEAQRLKAMLAHYGLPHELPEGVQCSAMLTAMAMDKKALAGKLRFVLPERTGSVVIREVDAEEVAKVLGG